METIIIIIVLLLIRSARKRKREVYIKSTVQHKQPERKAENQLAALRTQKRVIQENINRLESDLMQLNKPSENASDIYYKTLADSLKQHLRTAKGLKRIKIENAIAAAESKLYLSQAEKAKQKQPSIDALNAKIIRLYGQLAQVEKRIARESRGK